jgi:hypothetical protein
MSTVMTVIETAKSATTAYNDKYWDMVKKAFAEKRPLR